MELEWLPLAHVLECLAPVIGTVWKGLGGVALKEKVCHWEWAWQFQKRMPGPVSLSAGESGQAFSPASRLPVCLPAQVPP